MTTTADLIDHLFTEQITWPLHPRTHVARSRNTEANAIATAFDLAYRALVGDHPGAKVLPSTWNNPTVFHTQIQEAIRKGQATTRFGTAVPEPEPWIPATGDAVQLRPDMLDTLFDAGVAERILDHYEDGATITGILQDPYQNGWNVDFDGYGLWWVPANTLEPTL